MSRGKKQQEYMCFEGGCRTAAFSRRYELERHKKSKHDMQPAIGDKNFYRCAILKCGSRRKWSRSDHFRLHAKRVHPDEDPKELLRRSTLSSDESSDAETSEAPHDPTLPTTDRFAPHEHGRTSEQEQVDNAEAPACLPRELSDSAVSLPPRVLSPVEMRDSPVVSIHQAAIPTGSTGASNIAQPSPIRASTPPVAQWLEELDNQLPLEHRLSAADVGPDIRRPSGISGIDVRSHAGGHGHHARRSSRGQQTASSSGLPAQSSSFGSQGQGQGQVQNDDSVGAPGVAGGRPSTGASTGDDPRMFPCVFHEFRGGNGDPDVKCRVRQKYVSKLFKHHQIRAHPHGPFFCCTKCFRKDFASEQEMNDHKSNGCRFLCVTWGCCNFDQTPTADRPCDTHGAGHNSQVSMWNKMYRIGRNLPADAPVPILSQGPTTSQSAQPPQPELTIHTPTPPQHIDWQSATPAPSMARSASAATGISTYSMSQQHTPQQLGPQYMPFSYAGGRLNITPSSSPSYSALGAFDQQASAAELERSLEGLAHSMWRQVRQPRPSWSITTCGWYTSSIQNLTRSTPYSRITMLQTLVEAYSVITERSSQLTLRDWEDICDLTRATLPAESVPEECPWVQSPPTDPAEPSLLSVSSLASTSSHSRFNLAPSYPQMAGLGSHQPTPFHLGSGLLPPATFSQQGSFQVDMSDVRSQVGSEAPTTYDRLHNGQRQVPAQEAFQFQNMPSVPSGISDPTYASASEHNPVRNGKARSKGYPSGSQSAYSG